uniref:Uncharacterized protein n=1 Tax=Rhizophora mucronata TaxID=61149 RepID=A0A2P2Q2B8_RHIMU
MGANNTNLAAVRGIYGQILQKGSLQGLILILQSKVNHFARKALAEFPFKVEIFHVSHPLG